MQLGLQSGSKHSERFRCFFVCQKIQRHCTSCSRSESCEKGGRHESSRQAGHSVKEQDEAGNSAVSHAHHFQTKRIVAKKRLEQGAAVSRVGDDPFRNNNFFPFQSQKSFSLARHGINNRNGRFDGLL